MARRGRPDPARPGARRAVGPAVQPRPTVAEDRRPSTGGTGSAMPTHCTDADQMGAPRAESALVGLTPYSFPCAGCGRPVTWTSSGWAATEDAALRCSDGPPHGVDVEPAAQRGAGGEVFVPGGDGFTTAPGEGWVTLDGYGYFPAQVAARKWNGWAVPSFRRPVVERLVCTLGRYDDARVGWNRQHDNTVIVMEFDAEAPYAVARDDSGRWPIGGPRMDVGPGGRRARRRRTAADAAPAVRARWPSREPPRGELTWATSPTGTAGSPATAAE